jgi:ubiquinone/menaquinone biosynthesis C-methylase UbiE
MPSPKFDKPEEFEKALKDYWEQEKTISIIDKNLHKIEIDTVLSHLTANDRIADIGCGCGDATVRYAEKVKSVRAFERSDKLRGDAQENVAKVGAKNVTLEPGDVMTLTDVGETFDAVVSQRMLINLPSWEAQQVGLNNIVKMLKPGGRLIMVENTDDAFAAMNDMRAKMGMGPVPQHWHNLFFDYDKLKPFMAKSFDTVKEYDFGLYYFLTRVYVPMFASFVGFGANAVKDPIFEKSDTAAREIYEKLKDQVQFPKVRALGPIQCFVYKKKG